MINKITQDMVGLKFHIVSNRKSGEFNEYTVKIRFEELSDDGIELFGLTDEDFE